jgi:CheY-like chemotaxis protein
VSHELRTPLNAILGFARLMVSDADEPLSCSQRARLRHVLEGGDHLLGLVNEVLEISSLEQGAGSLTIGPVALQEVVDATLHLLAPLAGARGITLLTRPCTQAVVLPSDRRRLEQVLLNLVSNAIKYNRPHGTVEVGLREVEAGIEIEVSDSGIGMTAQQLAHLFEPFNRLGSERSGVEGAGLGLVLCRKLVELLGGTLHIESQPREGTQARVMLPRVPPAAPSPVPLAPRPQPAAGSPAPVGRVLYVEDNPVNVVLVEQLLARWPGVELFIAEDGHAGIEMARARRPDLVLLDMQLPDLDGLDVLDALRADAHTVDLPVLMVSASAMPEQVRAATARGADGYLTKPIDFERFELEVRQWLCS